MIRRPPRALLALAAVLVATAARPWGAGGHRTVGALADRLIGGTHAQAQVRALLGGLTLEQAAVWADCAKGVDPARGYAYTSTGRFRECAIFETPEGEAEMIDFVRRNDINCPRAPTESSCHAQYHYTDEAIQRRRYRLGDVGTRVFDIVAATGAAIRVLEGAPVPAPFDIKDRREALLLLSHYVGDIAQPLHVGAVYLAPDGRVVDPQASAVDAAGDTQGGNRIVTARDAGDHRGETLHAAWDDIPQALHADHIDADWVTLARAEPATHGDIEGWPAQWASATLVQARLALQPLRFGPGQARRWTVALAGRYDDAIAPIKKRQLTLAGARLARTLAAIWP